MISDYTKINFYRKNTAVGISNTAVGIRTELAATPAIVLLLTAAVHYFTVAVLFPSLIIGIGWITNINININICVNIKITININTNINININTNINTNLSVNIYINIKIMKFSFKIKISTTLPHQISL